MESANNDGIFFVLFIQIFNHDFTSIFPRRSKNPEIGPEVFRKMARKSWFRTIGPFRFISVSGACVTGDHRVFVRTWISVFGVGLPRSLNFGLWRGSDYGFRCRSFRVHVPFWKSKHDCWNCPSIILVSKLRSWIIRLKSSRKRNASDWIAVFILEKVSPWSHLCVIGSSGSTDYWALGIHRAIREAAV